MGRSPCCDETGLKKGPWTPEEDEKLIKHIQKHGHSSWRALPKLAGLNRCGKSCRLRWTNYLRPDIKQSKFSPEEEQTVLNLHAVLGNKWSTIASHLPGRTDNAIKNLWNTHLKKKLIHRGFDPMTHRPRTEIFSSLSQLMSLANMRGLVDLQHHQYPMEAISNLHAEFAKLQLFFQYLLQPPSMKNINPNDLDIVDLLNSIIPIKDNSTIANLDLGLLGSYLQDFSGLPPLRTLDINHEPSPNPEDNHMKLFIQRENLPISPTWLFGPSSSSQTPLTTLDPSHVTEDLIRNPFALEDMISSNITASSCQESSATVSAAWTDQIFDDTLFPHIP